MKQHKHHDRTMQPLPAWMPEHSQRRSGRREMNRFFRCLFIVLLSVVVVASLLAGLASFRPWTVDWNRTILHQSLSSQAGYQVHLDPDAVPGVTLAPSDAVYLDELVLAVEPILSTRLVTSQPVSGQVHSVITATLQARQADSPAVLLQTSDVLSEQDNTLAGQTEHGDAYSARITLDPYRTQAAAIQERLDESLVFELVLQFASTYTLDLIGGPASLQSTASLVVPINQPVFRIERSQTDAPAEPQPLRQTLRYRIHLSLFPWLVFAIAAGLALLSLVLLLATTRSQPRDRFNRRLKRMKRQARGRLMMIGDRTWDPAWCVRVTDYPQMARTARKLKHPVFCYLDTLSAWPVAYFYTYYGENNYCHIFTEHPEALEESLAGGQAQPEDTIEEENLSFPVLPEEDELPTGGNSPEIKVSRPDKQPEQPEAIQPRPKPEAKP
ncbi:MAG: DUF5305 family protein [Eubacteriales bacterium]|nr:DUF5305 family protein [Eubacteriales bacterium]